MENNLKFDARQYQQNVTGSELVPGGLVKVSLCEHFVLSPETRRPFGFVVLARGGSSSGSCVSSVIVFEFSRPRVRQSEQRTIILCTS